ncbi:MAG: hypothetical protein K6C97_11270 [Treponema sp.]|nr:hypothetical protein [Treponema sp.]
MDKDEEKKFQRINQLYSSYIELKIQKDKSGFTDQAAYDGFKEKLYTELINLYLPYKKLNEKNFDVNQDNYSDLVFEQIVFVLDHYENSNEKERGYSFSRYACLLISNKKKKAASQKLASDINAGSSITEYEARMIRTIKKQVNIFSKFYTSEDKINKKIAEVIGCSVDTVIKYRNLSEKKCINIEDMESSPIEGSYSSTDNEETHQKLKLMLESINKKYLSKPNPMLSQVITVTILDSLKESRNTYIKENRSLEAFCEGEYNLLKEYDCTDKIILTSFFTNVDEDLPNLKDIENIYGLSKGAASHKRDRFFKDIIASMKDN